MMGFDDNGEPALNGTTTASVTINVPKCAQTATAPLPVVVFGHGLFSNAQTDMSNSDPHGVRATRRACSSSGPTGSGCRPVT